MEAETSSGDPPTTEFEDHICDRLHISEDSPSRIRTRVEVTPFSETVDLQAKRASNNTACINMKVDDWVSEGTDKSERLSRIAHAHAHGCPEGQVGHL